MGRRRCSEWPEPWVRRELPQSDINRLVALAGTRQLSTTEGEFVDDMFDAGQATLQQVAWLRRLARRYLGDRAAVSSQPPTQAMRALRVKA